MSVPDEEVIALLTTYGRSVGDYFLVGGLACSGGHPGGMIAMSIDDPALSVAVAAYLRRIGATEYATGEEYFRHARSRTNAGGPTQ